MNFPHHSAYYRITLHLSICRMSRLRLAAIRMSTMEMDRHTVNELKQHRWGPEEIQEMKTIADVR